MDRFLFGGRGLSSVFHVNLILSLSISLSFSHFTPSLSTNSMQEKQHRGSTSSSIFYLAANNPGQQQPRLGPSSLPEKKKKEKEKVLQWRREEGLGGEQKET